VPKTRKPERDRFLSHVDRGGPIPEDHPELGPCWLWMSTRTKEGFGSFELDNGKRVLAHRYVYDLAHGLGNQRLKRLCHMDSCTNPLHYTHQIPLTRRTKEEMKEIRVLKENEQRRAIFSTPEAQKLYEVALARAKVAALTKGKLPVEMESWQSHSTWDEHIDKWTPEQQAVFQRRKEEAIRRAKAAKMNGSESE